MYIFQENKKKVMNFELEGVVHFDTGIKKIKSDKTGLEYPWRRITLSVIGVETPFPISVHPGEDLKVGDEVRIPVVVIPEQKGLADGRVVTFIKLKSQKLFDSKIKK